MNTQNANLTISGIKCDAPGCDYRNEDVTLDGYGVWLNKPCPSCGANLLTEEDYNTVKLMVGIVQIANEAEKPVNNVDEPIIEAKINMNGTGSVEVADIKIK